MSNHIPPQDRGQAPNPGQTPEEQTTETEQAPGMPAKGEYSEQERLRFAVEHQTDQLERIANALEALSQSDTLPRPPTTMGEEIAKATGVDPNEAAETFAEALAGVGISTRCHVDSGRVWFQPTTFMNEPKFNAFIKSPDAIQYDPDNSPKQELKNYIQSSDVAEYVTEVIG